MKKEIKATENRNTETIKPVIVDEARLKSLEIPGASTPGEKIRALRKVCKISQDELACLTGISRKAIGQIERGECIPRLETLRQIEDALGLRAYFLSGDDVTGAAERIEKEVAVINFFRELKKKNLTDEEICRSLSAALTVVEIFS